MRRDTQYLLGEQYAFPSPLKGLSRLRWRAESLHPTIPTMRTPGAASRFTLPTLSLIWLLGGCGPTYSTAGLEATSVGEWRQDLGVLARELPQRHANAFHTVSRSEFESAVSALHRELSELAAESRYVRLRQLVAMIGDGHTSLQLPPTYSLLPLRFRWFGDAERAPADLELRVTHTTPEHAEVLGARVLRVGESTLAEAHDMLSTLVAQGESPGSSRVATAALLRRPELLVGLGFGGDVRMTFVDAEGGQRTLSLRPRPPSGALEWRRAASEVPLYLTRTDEPFWFTLLPGTATGTRTAYLAFNAYPSYFRFWRDSRALFDFLKQNRAEVLVIDLRNNAGGDFNKVRRLLIPGLRQRLGRGSLARLYVLTGPVTFSAAMTNATDFRQQLGAVLVGEPTGARPNQYQESGSFNLPNSGLRVTVSTRYYRFQEEDTPGVLPDRRIVPDWQDWLAGRDPALQWILDQPAT
jgi:hypothetical protein